MFIDKQTLMSNAQAITATAVSTDVIDLGADRDVGVGQPIMLLVQIVEAFNTLTSLQIDMQTDDNSSFSSATVIQLQSMALAALTLGARTVIPYWPRTNERYVRMNYTVTGTNPTLGKITAGVVVNDQNWQAYPNAI